MEIVAHRGLWHSAPENSLAAVTAALAAGFSLIEVDVRATRDGALYLLHDATLERTTDHAGRLSDLTAAQAARIRLADGEPLPALTSALRLNADRARLCLDVKDRHTADVLVAALRGREHQVEVWSSHRAVVATTAAAGARTALILSGILPQGIGAAIWNAWDAGAQALSFYPADLEPHIAAACRNAGMPFLCGAPNDEASWRHFAGLGVRALITDRPLACRALLRRASAVILPVLAHT